jgi:hypothetical protein
MSDQLPVLDELERRLIAGCYGPAAASQPSRRARPRARAQTLTRLIRNLGVPALAFGVTALVIGVAITAVLGHHHPPRSNHAGRAGHPGSRAPVVHNDTHTALPPLPAGSVTYFTGHLGHSWRSPNPEDTFSLATTQTGLLKPGEGPTRSTLTITATGLKPAPPGHVYEVWLAPASFTGNTTQAPLKVLPPYSLVGVITPPISTDGQLVARAPITVDVRQTSSRQFELLITIQHHLNATTPGHAVLRAVIS